MKNALSALDDFCIATIRAAMQYVPAYMAILPKDRLIGAGSFETALFLTIFRLCPVCITALRNGCEGDIFGCATQQILLD
jgi:hypothetical protein